MRTELSRTARSLTNAFTEILKNNVHCYTNAVFKIEQIKRRKLSKLSKVSFSCSSLSVVAHLCSSPCHSCAHSCQGEVGGAGEVGAPTSPAGGKFGDTIQMSPLSGESGKIGAFTEEDEGDQDDIRLHISEYGLCTAMEYGFSHQVWIQPQTMNSSIKDGFSHRL